MVTLMFRVPYFILLFHKSLVLSSCKHPIINALIFAAVFIVTFIILCFYISLIHYSSNRGPIMKFSVGGGAKVLVTPPMDTG